MEKFNLSDRFETAFPPSFNAHRVWTIMSRIIVRRCMQFKPPESRNRYLKSEEKEIEKIKRGKTNRNRCHKAGKNFEKKNSNFFSSKSRNFLFREVWQDFFTPTYTTRHTTPRNKTHREEKTGLKRNEIY